MSDPEDMMLKVSPRHAVLLASEYAQLVRYAPDHDFVMRTIVRREANGLQLMTAEIVIAGKETRRTFPMADVYPMHFRKSYFPGRLHGDPAVEYEHQERASKILDAPPPIAWTKNSFRSCFVPGIPYSRLTPFGLEPLENNIAVAEELDLAKAVGLWWLCSEVFEQLRKLHDAGMVHGDLELHNVAVSSAPAEPVLLDFELAKERKELTEAEWGALVKADFTELLREAVYLQCALGRQPGALAEMAMEELGNLFSAAGRFERRIRRQAAV